MKILSAVAAMTFLLAIGAKAEAANSLSDAETQGRNLVRQLLEGRPAENFTNTGILKIRNTNGNRPEIPLRFQTVVNAAIWSTTYETTCESNHFSLVIIHKDGKPNQYELSKDTSLALRLPQFLAGNETMIPFAGSDFLVADLGLEFFHWPGQKVLKKEIRRSCGCHVLESTNPNPSTNSYSRVVSWIDNDSGGIVQAEAYDFNNKLLKEFYPKNIKKVNGLWQVETLDIRNVQTGSRTRLEFDVNKK